MRKILCKLYKGEKAIELITFPIGTKRKHWGYLVIEKPNKKTVKRFLKKG